MLNQLSTSVMAFEICHVESLVYHCRSFLRLVRPSDPNLFINFQNNFSLKGDLYLMCYLRKHCFLQVSSVSLQNLVSDMDKAVYVLIHAGGFAWIIMDNVLLHLPAVHLSSSKDLQRHQHHCLQFGFCTETKSADQSDFVYNIILQVCYSLYDFQRF